MRILRSGRIEGGFLSASRFCLYAVLLCAPAVALDPSRQISQYAHTAWRIQDGVFSGTPHAITQTTDGYLWIGTEDGLVRFDGVRFVPWIAPDGKRLPSPRIYSLLGGSDGSLWIGTRIGLARWKNEELVDYSTTPGFVEAIMQDSKGTVWMTRSQVHDDKGPLCEVTDSALHCYGAADGVPFPYAQPLARDDLGNLWIGSSLGLCRGKPGSFTNYFPQALQQAKGLSGVSAIAAGKDAVLWVGMERSGPGLGLQQLVRGAWKGVVLPGMDGTALEVTSLVTDRNGALWIGTTNQGIYRIYGINADHFSGADGLSSDSVNGFYQDREGNLWVITSRGIDRFHDTRVTSFSIREGLTAENVGSVLASRDGTVWIGNVRALNVLRHGKLSAMGKSNGLPGRLVTSLFEDHAGQLWAGVDGQLTVYQDGRFRLINKPNGSPIGVITEITEDVEHDTWARISTGEIFRIHDFRVREEALPPHAPRSSSLAADPKGGIWLGFINGDVGRYRKDHLEIFPTIHGGNSGPVRNLLVDSDGSTWAASGAGLTRWKNGKAMTLTSRNGLPCDSIFAVVKDDLGSLWLDAQCGFVVIPVAELEKWWEQPDVKVKLKTFDVFDGVQAGLTNFRPEVSKSPDGKLWFANDSVLQMVDPAHLGGNEIPPPVRVEQVIADRKNYAPQDNLRLPPLTRDIEIDYTALSFAVPQKVSFRYKLEGHDADWQDPQTRRQAFYSDLPPGNYRFRVIASNNDGVWNNVGATQALTVLPAFYQTTWFRLLCFVIVAGILWLLYELRLRQVAGHMQARLEERLEERERIARDLHDTLLQGFLSAYMQLDVANDRLPADSPAKPLVQRVLDLMKQVSEEGRSTIRSLRSPQTACDGLEEKLSGIREEFPLQEQVDFRVIVEGKPVALHPVIREEVYRIAREAVINAFRHSQASKIEVNIKYAVRSLRIVVRDDGCGVDPQVLRSGREGHWGLSNMRERAEKIGARFGVRTRSSAGTEVALSVPSKVAFETVSSQGWWTWLTRWFPGQTGADVPPSRE
jgi:signal transduction histidine kinase/ligand-binding sensor domain-containing protein